MQDTIFKIVPLVSCATMQRRSQSIVRTLSRFGSVRPDNAALYRWKHDALEHTVCTLSELSQAASVAAGGADEMTRDVVHQQLDMLHSFVHAGASDE